MPATVSETFRTMCVLLVLSFSALARAGDLAADAKIAMPMLLKALTYDTNFDSRGLGDFTVLVVAEASQSDKRDLLLDGLKDMPNQKVKNRPLKYAGTEFKDEASLQAEIDRTRASALLVVPGLSTATLKHVWDVAQDNQAYVIALEASMVEFGLPIGVQVTGGKPQILINEKGAKSVGAKFETAILKLARVIQ
ncbi:MAG: hypothetical protein H6Q89_3121 [Myxococcaceae bacterium]|nr:hypothetical protein [Myxococcaceae bacterium]